ncbi:uncharacterized protein M6B38_403395 [Iris pallida]|uniref:C2 NT-type domain-containing protein n=1 Tax=Iris pallida TaxID=29817 RepID=A0AAX6FSZ0_IRIPA|nr:uncharacterized protein M6B38_403395 [Iris pallida]
MVAKMMRWRPWPPLLSRKFGVRVLLKKVDGLDAGDGVGGEGRVLVAEVRWKGPKLALGSLRRTVKRNCTREEEVKPGLGSVEWNEEFGSACTLTFHKDDAFHPWEVEIRVFNGLKHGPKNKASVIGMALLNLAEFASTAEEIEINLPLLLPGYNAESHPSLTMALSLLELRTSQDSSDTVQRSMMTACLSPPSGDAPSEKDEFSALKAGLRKVKILMSTKKTKKSCPEDEGSEGRCSARSDDVEYTYPFDTDSLDDDPDEGELEDGKEGSSIRKSFSYGTLSTANCVGCSLYRDMKINGEFEDWVYYSHRRSDVGCSHVEEMTSAVPVHSSLHTSKRSILPWKKRKLNFRSPKAKCEPLLKKGYAEEGGDDIDYDRRQLSSSDESLFLMRHMGNGDPVANSPSLSDFGDDKFAVGSWESKEVVSRDGLMKLSTKVFFASIDQRSEQADGESACTALVAVIADWFQSNQDAMPIQSQFDSLIREGSFEWRNLCDNQTYRERFPDKHFDLETVLQAKIRPLSVVSGKSFIGFFHPEGMDENSGFEVLHGAMSFDSIWDEISRAGSECLPDGCPQVYVVSWNDHFFVLKVEHDAYYIIDTLGERLYEGCNHAYILKFDGSTLIHKIQSESKPTGSEVQLNKGSKEGSNNEQVRENGSESEEEPVCRGKESCKEYVKSFLAAIPVRQLQADIKKGQMTSTPLHQRLQIEFHYTEAAKDVGPMVLSVIPSEELVQQEDPVLISSNEQSFGQEVLAITDSPTSSDEFFLRQDEQEHEQEREEAVAHPGEEFFLRQEEPVPAVAAAFSLIPAV